MYRFNDPTTDAEHDFIIGRFSELCEIVTLEEYDPKARESLLDLLLHYTSNHFHREEQVMRQAEYPHLESHLLAHAYMQEAFARMRASMCPDCPNLRADMTLLRQMFLDHILTQDEAYGAWRKSQAEQGS